MPKESDFRLVESPLPEPGAGEALVRALFLSVDPYMRGGIGGTSGHTKPVDPGEVMVGAVAGEVIESHDPRLAPGDSVEGMLGWQEYAVAPAKSLRKISSEVAPISAALSVLGMPGLTAYFGLLEICRPQSGETILISGAAGAVGSLVGQIAKVKRCRAIGIAGSSEKVRFLKQDLGFEAAFNYKESTDYDAALREVCPNGVDIYFDTVGGAITDAAIRRLNVRARVAVCGQISQYDSDEPEMGPRWLGQLIAKQAKVEGFQAKQFAHRFDEGYRQLAAWLHDGKIKYREDVVTGLENAPRAFIGMLQGRNIGKQLVKLDVNPEFTAP
jgi:hypothetical protein